MARHAGFIVSRYQKEPATVPITMPLGVIFMDCEGGYTFS